MFVIPLAESENSYFKMFTEAVILHSSGQTYLYARESEGKSSEKDLGNLDLKKCDCPNQVKLSFFCSETGHITARLLLPVLWTTF